jgi:beta-carotene hydroxylase
VLHLTARLRVASQPPRAAAVTAAPQHPLPPLAALGRDLLAVPRWRVAASLAVPFVLFAGYWAFAGCGWWAPAVGCVVALSFVSFGSISHDLVHRSLGLPRRWNDALLTAVELLLLRSGRAYRLSHLNHHSRYPHADDPEGRAAHGSAVSALLSGPTYFARLWVWAVRTHPAHRPRLVAEAAVVVGCVAAAVGLVGVSFAPLVYVGLAYLGTWVVPFVTSFVPHTPLGDSPLSQTRRFRGLVARLIAFDHLYHLEHHLYPAVPHHRWPELARRLDPHLDEAGVPRVSLGVGP